MGRSSAGQRAADSPQGSTQALRTAGGSTTLRQGLPRPGSPAVRRPGAAPGVHKLGRRLGGRCGTRVGAENPDSSGQRPQTAGDPLIRRSRRPLWTRRDLVFARASGARTDRPSKHSSHAVAGDAGTRGQARARGLPFRDRRRSRLPPRLERSLDSSAVARATRSASSSSWSSSPAGSWARQAV